MQEKSKYHIRTLEEIDQRGRVISTRIVKDLDALILDYFPELKEDYEKIQSQKKKGKLLSFPK